MKLLSVSLVVGLTVMALVGCDKGPQLPKQAEVSGTVMLDGKPMDAGEVRFFVGNEPPVTLPVTGGAFSGKVFVGQSRIDVVRDVDGPPHPMDPTQKMKVNSVDPRFMGPSSPFKHDISADGVKDLKFEVTSARR